MDLKSVCIGLGLAAIFGLPAAAAPTGGLELARANNCLSCHQVDRKRVGPAFNLVAQRFAGQPGAADYLAAAIRSGSRGHWGAIPMPAQSQVSPEQARAIAAWILTLTEPPLKP